MYAQIIDDTVGNTLVSASTIEKEVKAEIEKTNNVDAAAYLGTVIAKRAIEKGIKEVVFDRGGFVYQGKVAALADVLVLNSIEFWSGSNPVADTGNIQKIETKDGVYAIKTQKDGYQIQKEGEEQAIELVFNEAEQSWNIEVNNTTTKLFKFTNKNEVVMYLPNGDKMNVELNQAGVLAFKQVAEGYSYYAAR